MKTQTKWLLGGLAAVATVGGAALLVSAAKKPASTPEGSPQGTPAAPKVYTVQRGDTLGAIAQRFNTTVAKLVARNELANADLIQVGQRLTLPG